MRKFKISFIFLSLFFLTGCFQTTALLGPGVTMAASGNLIQAGLHYGANTAIKNETGEYPLTYIHNSIDEKNNQKKIHVLLKNFIEKKIEAARKKLSLN